jgi:hypothetical protein
MTLNKRFELNESSIKPFGVEICYQQILINHFWLNSTNINKQANDKSTIEITFRFIFGSFIYLKQFPPKVNIHYANECRE